MGCNCQSCGCDKASESKKSLAIYWQRLISDGNTCPRCGTTEDELDKAFLQLKDKLQPKGIEVILKKKELTIDEFRQNPLESNRITFNGQSLEELLDAKTGHSKCCDVCGDEECRTVETNEKNYETIPAELIVNAGIKAISQ
jgi:hypothetical protein